jgi:hypothetical protein
MLIILLCICSQIKINNIVGCQIDSLEARKYNLFTDIEDFISAQFSESGDSIIVRLQYLEQGIPKDSTVILDRETLKSLGSYINNFRMIIEDEHFRRTFVATFKIGWPIISQNDIDQVAASSRGEHIQKTVCCVTGGCALGAYSAALITRDIRTEIDTVGLPMPCLTGEGIGCAFIPLPIERKYYNFSEAAYVAGGGVGAGMGYLRVRKQMKSYEVLNRAISRNIVAFDDEEFPITEKEVAAANRGTNEVLLGTLGIGGGLLGATATLYVLLSPWIDKYPEERWQETAIMSAAVVISFAEFIVLARFFVNKGRQLDREATIERLKRRHQQRTGTNS